MNTRIKKIKEQATSYTWNGYGVTEELDEEKFAELIVRECIDIAYREGDNVAYLALHFGVDKD